MNGANDVKVLIDDKLFTISGVESKEYLQKIASYINAKYSELKKKGYYKALDFDHKNAFLAINMADDYYKQKKISEEYKEDIQLKDKTIIDMKHEIIDLHDDNKKKDEMIDALQIRLQEAEKKIVELSTRLEGGKK